MKRVNLRVGMILLAIPMIIGCASTQRAHLTTAELRDARADLMATDRAWANAAASDDINNIVPFWTHDAVIGFQDGPPPIIGREAIQAFLSENRNDPAFSISWTPEQAWVSADGTIGCTFGLGSLTRTDENGRVVTETDPYTCIWRNQGGLWKCVLDLRSPKYDREKD